MQEGRIVPYRPGHRSGGVRHWLHTMEEPQVILCEVHGGRSSMAQVSLQILFMSCESSIHHS
jgi:hypothetical protein